MVQGGRQPLPGIRNVIAVASGKGGVGKSTVAVNLALALALDGARVGLLDADIYGPSQPRMMGLHGPAAHDRGRQPHRAARGAWRSRSMSIGFLIDEEQPMVWRGPMVTQALSQLLGETDWGELDYLVVDMPPGTGDIQLTLSQRVPVSGAVDRDHAAGHRAGSTRARACGCSRRSSVPVLGIVENMSTHVCSQLRPARSHLRRGRRAAAWRSSTAWTCSASCRSTSASASRPTAADRPSSPSRTATSARAYRDMARRTAARLSRAGIAAGAFPSITVEES